MQKKLGEIAAGNFDGYDSPDDSTTTWQWPSTSRLASSSGGTITTTATSSGRPTANYFSADAV